LSQHLPGKPVGTSYCQQQVLGAHEFVVHLASQFLGVGSHIGERT
jgi:hypothetical protein